MTEATWEANDAQLTRLESVMHTLGCHVGLFEPFADGSDWALDRARQRLESSERFTPVVRAVFKSMDYVYRSMRLVASERETAIDSLSAMVDQMVTGLRSIQGYRALRADELRVEMAFDQVVECPTVHSEERSRQVDEQLQESARMVEAAISSLKRSRALLAEERTPTVEALYTARGGGVNAEFALRLVEHGVHPVHAALIRNDVIVSDPSLRDPVQRRKFKQHGELLRKEVVRTKERIRSYMRRYLTDANDAPFQSGSRPKARALLSKDEQP